MAYTEALSGMDIDFGKAFWHALRENSAFPVEGALWLSRSGSDSWHFLIASPKVDQIGRRQAYEELSRITRQLPVDSTQFSRVELISPEQPLYQALRSVFGKKASVEGTRLGHTQIEGLFINDAYLYEIG